MLYQTAKIIGAFCQFSFWWIHQSSDILRRPQNLKKSSTKIWHYSLKVKFQVEDFFQILWPSQNIRTLLYHSSKSTGKETSKTHLYAVHWWNMARPWQSIIFCQTWLGSIYICTYLIHFYLTKAGLFEERPYFSDIFTLELYFGLTIWYFFKSKVSYNRNATQPISIKLIGKKQLVQFSFSMADT